MGHQGLGCAGGGAGGSAILDGRGRAWGFTERGGDGAKGEEPSGAGPGAGRLWARAPEGPGSRPEEPDLVRPLPSGGCLGSTEGSRASQGAVPGSRWSLVSGFSFLVGPLQLDKSCRQTL